MSIEINRPKEQLGKAIRFYDRNADVSGITEFRGVKDPNFKSIVEKDTGFQAAATQIEQGHDDLEQTGEQKCAVHECR